MTDEERKEIEHQTRTQCARIAALESNYWAGVEDDRPHMQDICIGAMGAAANICAALFMGRTEEEVCEDIENRSGPDFEAIEQGGKA